MHYSGYAFTEGSEEKQAKIMKRYQEIKHLDVDINVEVCYAHNNFKGIVDTEEAKALTEMDLLILADTGNLCFGGCCDLRGDGSFSGYYNTD